MNHTAVAGWTRREWLRLCSAGLLGCSYSGWLERFAAAAAKDPKRRRSCVLLWMSGGPSQMDTFDLKPGHKNGGPFKEIATSVPGIRMSEHLPNLARHMDKMVLVRSMSTKEADHGRATYLMRTGRPPGGPVLYPTLGSVLSKELGREDAQLPNFVSIAPFRFLSPGAFEAGFLGPQHAPLVVGETGVGFGQPGPNLEEVLKVEDLARPGEIAEDRSNKRIGLIEEMNREFAVGRSTLAARAHQTAYNRAVALMRSPAGRAFELNDEPAKVRERYGQSLFGQGCLLARRLVEQGVPFVEVTLSNVPGVNNGVGWDTHQDNFESVKRLCQVLDPAWSALMEDLRVRGLEDSTLVVWMGEFGRTPQIARGNGRDHWSTSWTTVLAGGGIRGGRVVGATSKDGMEVRDRPVSVADFLATVGLAVGVDVMKQNMSNLGRPIRIVEPTAKPIREIIA